MMTASPNDDASLMFLGKHRILARATSNIIFAKANASYRVAMHHSILPLSHFYAIIHLKVGDFMNSTKQKQISSMLILAVSFLIESPLRTTILSILSFSQPLGYIVTSIVFYIALFGCFLIASKPNISSKSVLKSICLALGFFIFEQIISVFLFSEIIALVYEIIRPLIIFVVILLGSHWLLKNKLNLNKLSWIILGGAFILGALFNVLEYIRVITMIRNMGNDFFSYLSMLTPSNSVYSIVAKLCTYIFTIVLFTQNKDSNNTQD